MKWGVLGGGNISKTFIDSIKRLSSEKFVALASKSGRVVGEPEKFYDDYEKLLEDPEIDAVYIALPNNMHAKYAINAMKAGKHVLCEKPAFMKKEEGIKVKEVSRETGKFFMEAFMYRFHPIHKILKGMVMSKRYGKLKHIDFLFAIDKWNQWKAQNFSNYRCYPEYGGGAMYDLGCYFVDFVRWITGKMPELVYKNMRHDNGVDIEDIIVTKLDDIFATAYLSFVSFSASITLIFEKAYVTVPYGVLGRENHKLIIISKEKNSENEKVITENALPYVLEIKHFSETVSAGKDPEISIDESIELAAFTENVLS
ncbi:Gfo/Idh/MocA family oxidoreductase [Thermosipho ferrireducens]|uniref:Gfo/Idh/MocA family oxidoreductase n=1 Tax=Thermosipho ferrireducens TaxID=2571116 RepID=A0ABX7S8A3_9BACT|nr:Gfo/Idh/MocA family oxidoreductase [Thermosipho ferrireducens]QTA38829.1 Gfo/Idh/MocA family oxidoreductase [Thermosipho ferrireducens]